MGDNRGSVLDLHCGRFDSTAPQLLAVLCTAHDNLAVDPLGLSHYLGLCRTTQKRIGQRQPDEAVGCGHTAIYCRHLPVAATSI